MRKWYLAGLSSLLLMMLLGSAAATAVGPVSHGQLAPRATGSHPPAVVSIPAAAATSTSWGGYVVRSGFHSISDVRANWHVPQIAAACTSLKTGSDFFVGMDDWTTVGLEAVGTFTVCVGGSAQYFAWVEYGSTYLTLTMKISPADQMFGEVKYSGGATVFTIKDLTIGKSYSKTVSGSGNRATAEWIANDPASGSSLAPLTDFGWVTFTNASATISGHHASISGFSHLAVTMWNLAGTKVKASVGGLSSGGSQFRVTWKSRGP